MTTGIQRFDFGSLRDFRAPFVVPEVIVEEMEDVLPPPPPPPTFSQEDLDHACAAAKKLGYAEGFDAGIADEQSRRDAKRESVDQIILAMGGMLNGLQDDYETLLNRESGELSALVLAIARKVAGDALAVYGADATTALIAQCLPVIFSKPRLSIELHPDMFDSTLPPIEALLKQSGFEGEVQFRANSQMGMHDVRLDWGNGQAARSTAMLWQEIEQLIAAMPLMLTPPIVP